MKLFWIFGGLDAAEGAIDSGFYVPKWHIAVDWRGMASQPSGIEQNLPEMSVISTKTEKNLPGLVPGEQAEGQSDAAELVRTKQHWAEARRIGFLVKKEILQIAKDKGHKHQWEALKYLDEQRHGKSAQRALQTSKSTVDSKLGVLIQNLFQPGSAQTVLQTASKQPQIKQTKQPRAKRLSAKVAKAPIEPSSIDIQPDV